MVVITPIDVIRLSSEHDPWWRTMIQDAITIIGKSPNDLVDFYQRDADRLRRDSNTNETTV